MVPLLWDAPGTVALGVHHAEQVRDAERVLSRRRILPRLRSRWERWQERRANRRRRPAQMVADEEIRLWLRNLLDANDGAITSADLDAESDELKVTVSVGGRTGILAFLYLCSWPNLEPRDDLTDAVREALRRDTADFDYEFFLSS